MFKKVKTILLAIIVLVSCTIFSACDPGIYDLPGAEEFNPFKGIDIKQVLDAKVCYNQVLKDLEFMKSTCYSEEKLAGAQAYTILMSYGLADMAKESSTFTAEQLMTKANLYSTIKLINLHSNNLSEGVINFYNSAAIRQNTDTAIMYCNLMLSYFPES